jgi:hypothetical protein
VFEGGSGNGVPGRLAWIDFKRLGRAFETERITGMLRAPNGANDADRLLEALSGAVSDLPDSVERACQSLLNVSLRGASLAEVRGADKQLQAAFLEGVRNAREDALFKVRQIRSGEGPPRVLGANSREQLLGDLLQTYEQKRSVLVGYAVAREKGRKR